MKRMCAAVLLIGMLFLLAACGEEKTTAMEFDQLLREVTRENQVRREVPDAFAGFEAWLPHDPETADLLTDEEIQRLLNVRDSAVRELTGEQAAYDADVLFRAFRSAYGAYYYFGEEAFEQARAELAAWLNGKTSVSTAEFRQKLNESLSFLRDAHVVVGQRADEPALRWEYHYCTDQIYGRDEQGYYQQIDGKTWYAHRFSDERVTMEPTLTENGALVWSPVLLCPAAEVTDSTVTLKDETGREQTQKLVWRQSGAHAAPETGTDFRLLREDGLVYLSQRSFAMKYADGEIAEFVASGAELAEAEVILLDLRGNTGGSEEYIGQWIANFTGQTPEPFRAFSTRFSPLQAEAWRRAGYPLPEQVEMGSFLFALQQGAMLENSTPVIVLVDDKCSSAGESALNFLRGMEQVLVVGSNTAGYQLCGNQMVLALPNSHLTVAFGVSLQFNDTLENVDFRGFEPDVWCDPEIVLESVLKMLRYYDLASAEAVTALREKL